MAVDGADSRGQFATERFIRSDCTQKENCRAFHKLSTDIKLYDTLQTKMNEMARSMKRQRSSISGRKLMKTRKFCGKQFRASCKNNLTFETWIDWNAAKKKNCQKKKRFVRVDLIGPKWPPIFGENFFDTKGWRFVNQTASAMCFIIRPSAGSKERKFPTSQSRDIHKRRRRPGSSSSASSGRRPKLWKPPKNLQFSPPSARPMCYSQIRNFVPNWLIRLDYFAENGR